MNDPRGTDQHEAPPAALHGIAHREPHVDSEENVQYERQRFSQELGALYPDGSPGMSSGPSQARNHGISSSRNASLQDSFASQDRLRRAESRTSDTNGDPRAIGTTAEDSRSSHSSQKPTHWYTPITKFWTTHVSLTIDDGAHRDHLALERTFLAYLRTSLILVMTGVLIAQLFRLQHAAHPNPQFGFYVVGRPLSIAFISLAILVLLVGAWRCWKLQAGLVRGKAYAGGWEVVGVMGLSGLLLFATFVVIVGINVEKALEER